MTDKVEYVQFLHDSSEIKFSVGQIKYYWELAGDECKSDLNLILPIQKPLVKIPVVEVYLK